MQYNLKKENERCESAINGQLGVMLDLIESKYLSDPSSGKVRPLDWGYLASYFSIDSITDISFIFERDEIWYSRFALEEANRSSNNTFKFEFVYVEEGIWTSSLTISE